MENRTSRGGVGFLGLLTIAFIVLKLCGVITWSWWLVLLPLFVGFGIGIIALLIIAIAYIIAK